ncbi:MAG: metallophosphoesterase [Thermosynechococcaceae cyanobacterium]
MNHPRRRLKHWSQRLLLMVGLIFGVVFYSHNIEPNWIQVKTIPLQLPHLASEFSGYRIVQLSDIHADPWMTAQRLGTIVERVNRLQPNTVVLTGDFVTRSAAQFAPHLLALKALHPTDKTLAVLGNHDAWSNPDLVQSALETFGVDVLANQVATLSRESAQLHIAGVDDVWAKRDRLDAVLASLPPNGASILLAHEPDFATRSAATERFDLQLSGHSHGGQVHIPFLPRVLPALGEIYPIGQYQVGSMIQYTNRGVGMSGLPFRFNCRPEITVFTLHPTA